MDSPRSALADAGLPPLIVHLLHRRGIQSADDAALFLGNQATQLEDPRLLPDIELAKERLHAAKRRGERVAVYGDFDADGVTGTALLVKALQQFGLDTIAYIPHRVTEGHGLNEKAIQLLRDKGASLILTVDCGVTDVEAISKAKAGGTDVIVTDHHLTADRLPDAVAIINPHAPRSAYPFDHLTGVGMTLKIAQALLEEEHPDTWSHGLMELAAIGTITDMAPLLGENRHIVMRGIEQLRRTSSPGLLALMEAARIEPGYADATDIGFGIGPRLNAAGRMDHADIAYDLLVTSDQQHAAALVKELDAHNRMRQTLTAETLEQARESIGGKAPPVIMLGSPEFNPGVVGLVAGKLADEFGVPALVYAVENGRVLGSCRSGPDFHWANALDACEELLLRHGGHAQAAGFSCEPVVLDSLRQRLEALAVEWSGGRSPVRARSLDALACLPDLMGPTFQALRKMEPFGVGNPKPLFLSRGLDVEQVSTMGAEKQHLRLTLRADGAVWNAVAFRQSWVPGTAKVDIVHNLTVDRWNGRERLQLHIEDYAPAYD
ncbi:MAG: single-stranded-DNA-specific exonuclease RecJ [Dehalococcoidia bacterium]